jgi:hypothetical protein
MYFCAYVKQCGFIDLGYSGPAYTWTNKRFATNPTYERLDRFLGNAEWCVAFPSTTIYHLPMLRSDHVPILAVLNSNHFKTNRPFRFENWWLREQEYHMVAQQVGSAQLLELLPRKLNSQPLIFGNGKKRKPRIPDQLAAIETHLL